MLNFDERLGKLLDETIKTTLEQDEGVKWVGRPYKIKLLAPPFGTMIILQWVFCVILLGLGVWFSFIYAPANGNSSGPVLSIILLLAAIFIALRPVYDVSLIQGKSAYIITNKRVIVCLLSQTPKIKSARFSDSQEYDIDMLSPLTGNIYIGGKDKSSLSKSRVDMLVFPAATDKAERPLVMYNVENPYDVTKYISA